MLSKAVLVLVAILILVAGSVYFVMTKNQPSSNASAPVLLSGYDTRYAMVGQVTNTEVVSDSGDKRSMQLTITPEWKLGEPLGSNIKANYSESSDVISFGKNRIYLIIMDKNSMGEFDIKFFRPNKGFDPGQVSNYVLANVVSIDTNDSQSNKTTNLKTLFAPGNNFPKTLSIRGGDCNLRAGVVYLIRASYDNQSRAYNCTDVTAVNPF